MNPLLKQTTAAIALTKPEMRTVLLPDTLEEVPHLAYDAEVQYVRKPSKVRMILCSQMDHVEPGNPVMLTYHSGLRCYQHAAHVSVSSDSNCYGGFFYTSGDPA